MSDNKDTPSIRKDRAVIGVSVSNPYYTKNKYEDLIAWASLHFEDFAFLIGDWINRYTIFCFNKHSLKYATEIALAQGLQCMKTLEKANNYNQWEVKTIRWEALKLSTHYNTSLNSIISAYKHNTAFAVAVREQVHINLHHKIKLHREHIPQTKLKYLDFYILNEIAGLITVSESWNYNIELYPGPDLKIMQSIYENTYPELSNILLAKKRETLEINI